MSLVIDRELQNNSFASWRLGHDFVRFRHAIDLAGRTTLVESDAVDYLHTRAISLHNHLLASEGRLFLSLHDHHREAQIVRLVPVPGAEPPFLMVKLAGR